MTEQRPPTTPREVSTWIGNKLREKRALLDTLHEADNDARVKRRVADTAEARIFLNGTGSIPARKYSIDTDEGVERARGEADVAEALVGHLKRMVTQLGEEIDSGRTVAATLRQELQVLGLSDEGH